MVILIGGSSSGKSTVEQEVDKRGICNKLTSHTTRPMRANEIEGVDYYFVNEDDLLEMEIDDSFIEERQYITRYGCWIYGLSKQEVDNNLDGIVVLDLEGAKELERYMEAHHPDKYVITIFIDCSSKTRLLRSLNRDSCNDDKCAEICRRYLDDNGWIKEAKDYCDFILKNETKEDFEEIINFIIYIRQIKLKNIKLIKKIIDK